MNDMVSTRLDELLKIMKPTPLLEASLRSMVDLAYKEGNRQGFKEAMTWCVKNLEK